MRLRWARKAAAPVTRTIDEQPQVDCTWCNVPMTSHLGSGGTICYFHCPSCQRWTTSVYSEVLHADTKMRQRDRHEAPLVAADDAGR